MYKYKVFIDGAMGTTGLKIQQRLAQENDIQLLFLAEAMRKDQAARVDCIKTADASILCLPDDAAKDIMQVVPETAKICDASTAHRVAPGWVYGFPELKKRSAIQESQRIAIPGCYATGFTALVKPLIEMGAINSNYPLACHAFSGYSGGGKKTIAAYEETNRPPAYQVPRQYALNMQHKHLPEMTSVAGLEQAPLFSPVICDYYAGMVVYIPLHINLMALKRRSKKSVLELFQDYYRDEVLIQVKDCNDEIPDGFLAANRMAGRDDLEILIAGNDERLLLACCLDNLGKGASGAAIQCLNLLLGRQETQGLKF